MIYLLYYIYSKINGATEAFIYGKRGAESLPGNEHTWFVAERVLVFFFVLAGMLYIIVFGWLWALIMGAVEAVGVVLAFSYFHNGHYNLMRDKIHGWSNGWKHTSGTDTSETNFTYVQRRNQFYISLAVLVVGYSLYFLINF